VTAPNLQALGRAVDALGEVLGKKWPESAAHLRADLVEVYGIAEKGIGGKAAALAWQSGESPRERALCQLVLEVLPLIEMAAQKKPSPGRAEWIRRAKAAVR
jgi:hypothetical protein